MKPQWKMKWWMKPRKRDTGKLLFPQQFLAYYLCKSSSGKLLRVNYSLTLFMVCTNLYGEQKRKNLLTVTSRLVLPMVACPAEGPISNLAAAQVSNPPLPALCFLHEGCLEGKCAVFTLIQCTPLLVEKAGVAPDMTLRFTTCKQVRVQAGKRTTLALKSIGMVTWSKAGIISGPTKWTLVQQKFQKKFAQMVNLKRLESVY